MHFKSYARRGVYNYIFRREQEQLKHEEVVVDLLLQISQTSFLPVTESSAKGAAHTSPSDKRTPAAMSGELKQIAGLGTVIFPKY